MTASHFVDETQQRDAATLGIWLLVGSEALLFASLFLLYAAARAAGPVQFAAAVDHTDKALGSANTFVLLVSSALVAAGVAAQRAGHTRRAGLLTLGTVALALLFLVLKALEYSDHLSHGLAPGTSAFWTLYYVLTGLHAAHVVIGALVLAFFAVRFVMRKRSERDQAFENAAVFWHFVDVVWIFLWPLFYLTGAPS